MSIGVSDIIASGSFYDAILEPMGYSRVFEDLHPGAMHQAIGYGVVPDEDIFAINYLAKLILDLLESNLEPIYMPGRP